MAAGSTVGAYQQERDIGALSVGTVSGLSAEREVFGRWGAVMLQVIPLWLSAGPVVLPLALLHWLPCECGAGVDLVIPWIFSGLWACVLAALGLYCSARARTSTAATVGTMAIVLGAPMVYPFVFIMWAAFATACFSFLRPMYVLRDAICTFRPTPPRSGRW